MIINKKGIIPLMSSLIIIGSLFYTNNVDAESVEKHTPVSNTENTELLIPNANSLNQGELEVKPILPMDSPVNNNSSYIYEQVINGVLEEESEEDTTFSDNEGKIFGDLQKSDIAPLSLIGTNDRRVRNKNTTIHPYNTISYLYTRWPDGTASRCTGFIIDRDSVATAGHCIHNIDKGWASSVTVRPGANGADNFPYGAFEATDFYSVTGWTEDEDMDFDYGVINIDGTFPLTIGTFGYGVATGSNFDGEFARITGYPTDIGGVDYNKPLYTQWYHSGTIDFPLFNSRLVVYDADTSGGQSGSPVYIPGENIARAIHGGNYSKSLNRGVRITDDVFTNIRNWAAR